MGLTQTILKIMENNMLKWYGHVLCMEDTRRPKRIMTWSPEGGGRRGRPEIKWEKEVERVMKQKNLTPEDAVNMQIWRKVTENQ
jgi:hypothetical protein